MSAPPKIHHSSRTEVEHASPLIEIIGVTDNLHQFFRQENLAPSSQIPALNVDQSIAALELAANGMGHALVSELFALPYLQDGRLARSLPLEKHTDQAIYATCPEGPVNYGSQMFLDWIIKRSSPIHRALGRLVTLWGPYVHSRPQQAVRPECAGTVPAGRGSRRSQLFPLP